MPGKRIDPVRLERETRFIQIPGPNPILVPGAQDAWDGGVIEACNVLKDGHTYYLYYHGTPQDEKAWPRKGYRLGVATAPHPLGPWTKHEGNPILDLGPEGSWEGHHVACAAVLKEQADKFYMWYSAVGKRWSVGLATATGPLGPWKKYPGNPVLKDFGYTGGVVKVSQTYRLYAEHPISGASPDQGPFALATAKKPEGPWRKYAQNPVLPAGDWGAWDDGGFSEAGVLYHDGVFHVFYGGTKWAKLESIGYAYSLDGRNFVKHSGNPVAPRERNPDASAFAEVHALWEPPFYYVYHTLRYISKGGEDLGVQVLAAERPFRLAMPALAISRLEPGQSTALADCPPISLERINQAALTVECVYPKEARAPLRVRILASPDGLHYDTEAWQTFEMPRTPGQRAGKTVPLEAGVMFVKVVLENLDDAHDLADVKVIATLGAS